MTAVSHSLCLGSGRPTLADEEGPIMTGEILSVPLPVTLAPPKGYDRYVVWLWGVVGKAEYKGYVGPGMAMTDVKSWARPMYLEDALCMARSAMREPGFIDLKIERLY